MQFLQIGFISPVKINRMLGELLQLLLVTIVFRNKILVIFRGIFHLLFNDMTWVFSRLGRSIKSYK